MAGNVNNAYMLWRQFSGDARPTAGQQNASLRPVQVQADRRLGETTGEAFKGFLTNLAGFANAYESGQNVEKKVADDRVKQWMRTQTVEEYRKKIEASQTPFQNDPLAMAALHRNTGAALAFEVEEKFQNQVKQGAFKTPQEADEARITMLNEARRSWGYRTGLDMDEGLSKAFDAGFGIQQDERRALTQRLQQDVTDGNLQKEAIIGVKTMMTAPMTPDYVKAVGPQGVADYTIQMLNKAQVTGLVRNPETAMEVINHAMTNLQGVPGGADAMTELGNREVTIGGRKATLRTFLGGGTWDNTVLKARDLENGSNTARFVEFHARAVDAFRAGDVQAVDAMIVSANKESGGKTTNEIEKLMQIRAQMLRTIDHQNSVMATKQAAEDADRAQYQQGISGFGKFLAGGLVSNDYKDLGFKDAAQGRKAEEDYLNSYKDPVERMAVAIKFAGKFKEGFSSNALQQWADQGREAFEIYTNQVAAGNQNAVVPQHVQQMLALYDRNPENFLVAFKDQPYTQLYEAGKRTGQSLADMTKAKIRWDSMPKDEKQASEKALTIALSKSAGQGAYMQDSLKSLATNYMMSGMSGPSAVNAAMDNFKKQHMEINGGFIHKTFFTDDTKDVTNSQFAEGVFKDKVLPDLVKQIGGPSSYGIIYSPTDRSVWVRDLTLGTGIQYSREQMQEATEKSAAELREKARVEQEAVMEKARVKAEKKAREMERGIFPNNRHDGDGFSGKPKKLK